MFPNVVSLLPVCKTVPVSATKNAKAKEKVPGKLTTLQEKVSTSYLFQTKLKFICTRLPQVQEIIIPVKPTTIMQPRSSSKFSFQSGFLKYHSQQSQFMSLGVYTAAHAPLGERHDNIWVHLHSSVSFCTGCVCLSG